ncbi:TonB-dependent receptor domain-containing protein [Belliella pelovolcani]|uniref:Outer membrane receptor proteins, mostly Fe transport n=1 Tax=Belliella pelovolcani TaxID=529505 RepID=A0A1N7LXX2_9BACT|nr:TonB-dependent receptor [Belliella pelovolcani]SIS78676.1 Outer membrane receptor proteins, mostly Fe transport [Belliella pelovolcani]
MKYIFSILLFPLLSFNAFAQTNVKGKIIDSLDDPIPFVLVSFLDKTGEELVSSTVADEVGFFQITLDPDTYQMVVSFMGFRELLVPDIKVVGQVLDLGQFKLEESVQELSEYQVEGKSFAIQQAIGKQIFSSSDFEAAVGGNVTDILRNLPSISINGEGELTLRGSTGFLLLLNGKPVQGDAISILGQLPANMIENIEITSSPSSKFDADGKAGVINILTKKGTIDGLSLVMNGFAGAPSLDLHDNQNQPRRYNADFTLNYIKNKWDIAIGADFNRNDIAGFRNGTIEVQRGDTLTRSNSSGERSYRRNSFSYRGLVSYNWNEMHKTSASINAGAKRELRTADLLYNQSRRTVTNPVAFENFPYFNENGRERNSDFLIIQMDHSWKISKNSKIDASILYEKTALGGPTTNINRNPENPLDVYDLQKMEEFNPLEGFRANIDFENKIADNLNFMAGYQFRRLNHTGVFDFFERDFESGIDMILPEFSSDILLERDIHAFYSQINGQRSSKLDYSFGLRLEKTDRNFSDNSSSTNFNLSLLNLFPNLNINYALGDYAFNFGYSRRIDRTITSMMNPFFARRHAEVLEVGDPELLPEFTDAVEIGAKRFYDKGSLFLTSYYRRTTNSINRINAVFNDSILLRVYTNAGVSNVLGLETGTEYEFTDWAKIYFGANIFYFNIKGELMGEPRSNSSLNSSFDINTTIGLTKGFDLIFNLNYLSRTVTFQGEESSFFSPNLSLKKSLPRAKLDLALHWRNIGLGMINSNRQIISGSGTGFFTSTEYISERDIVAFSVSYRLNQLNKLLRFSKSEFGDKEY